MTFQGPCTSGPRQDTRRPQCHERSKAPSPQGRDPLMREHLTRWRVWRPPRIVTPSELARQRGGLRTKIVYRRFPRDACPKICKSRSQPDSSPQEAPKSVQKTLNILPNPSQTLPKSTQDRSPSPFGAHLAPMLEKRSIWNAPKAARKHPKAPKRRPRPSQTLPKWIHRPLPNQFFFTILGFFITLKNNIDFVLIFSQFLWNF